MASTETYAAPGTSGNVLTSDGTNWASSAPAGGGATVKVSGSDFTTTSLSLVAVTGMTSATLSINSLYEVDIMLRVQSTSTAGLKVGLLTTTGSAKLASWLLSGDTGGTGTSAFSTANFGTAFASSLAVTANTDDFVWVKGIIMTDASATTIQTAVLKVTSGTATVYIGSRMTLTKLS